MTNAELRTAPAIAARATAEPGPADLIVPVHHPHRWRLNRAGLQDIWHYIDNEFDLSSGRGILRGPNGSGKSRALELLLPFLLDADRRNMATGSPVKMEDLMERGMGERTNRVGYMWLELKRTSEDETIEYYTLGAGVKYNRNGKTISLWYFTTPLRVGYGLRLRGEGDIALSRGDLAALIGVDRVTDRKDAHQDRVRTDVYGLSGDSGRDRFAGLVSLLHTLRDPDIGNEIEAGDLAKVLGNAMPPLADNALTDAGQALDGLQTTREDLQRIEDARGRVEAFLAVYRRWLTGQLDGTLENLGRTAQEALQKQASAHELAQRAADLDARRRDVDAAASDYAEKARAAGVRIEGLKSSKAYQSVAQLTEMRKTVEAKRITAESCLVAAAHARESEISAAQTANNSAAHAEEEATRLAGLLRDARASLAECGLENNELPTTADLVRNAGTSITDVVRIRADEDPQSVSRPAVDDVHVPAGLPARVHAAADAAAHAAGARSTQAAARHSDAKRLAGQKAAVKALNQVAAVLNSQAQSARDAATAAAESRDVAAVAVADAWHTYITSASTTVVFGAHDWTGDEHLGPLLADNGLLAGDGDLPISLADLDGAARRAAAGILTHIADVRAQLKLAEAADLTQAKTLRERQRVLLGDADPEPELPPWRVPAAAPLWKLIDFAPAVPPADRDGIEAALEGAGLLSADVTADGAVRADTGELLLSAGDAAAENAVTVLLKPDAAACAAAGVTERTVTAVLSQLSVSGEDDCAGAVIGVDGSWRNGPLRGRNPVSRAKFIGASARAANRAAELDAIRIGLSALANAERERRTTAGQLDDRQRAVDSRIAAAPTTTALVVARSAAVQAEQHAAAAENTAADQQREADAAARKWRQENETHRQLCTEQDLPIGADDLSRLETLAKNAANACRQLPGETRRLCEALARWQADVAKASSFIAGRDRAESDADSAWAGWHDAQLAFDTLFQAVGEAAQDVADQIKDAEDDQTEQSELRDKAEKSLAQLREKNAIAAANANTEADRAAELAARVSGEAAAAARQLALPGVIPTVFQSGDKADLARVAFAGSAPAAVLADVLAVRQALPRARTGDTQLAVADREFAAEVGEMYDVQVTAEHGIRLFELKDGAGSRTLAAAAEELSARYERTRHTLTEHERRMFTDYVLGELGDELRTRIGQAETLVTAMNRSLATIRTSHDLQVSVKWGLDDTAGEDIAGIDALIRKSAALRTDVENDQLVSLLRTRVETAASADPSAGYSEHLKSALDYRSWYRIEVLVRAPHLGDGRRPVPVGKRSKISQGEIRTVSYVTLFAAADAFLTGMDDARALRLILLDDAFAKVDEHTIAQLLTLLVRMDVDFLMTGHALWGCYPGVPGLDVYTVIRQQGTAAATQHTHWDGHTAHLRAT